jgi:hypothetical protein
MGLPDTTGGDQRQLPDDHGQQQTPQTPSQTPNTTTSATFFNLEIKYPMKPGGNY